jgi:hypothetical protein
LADSPEGSLGNLLRPIFATAPQSLLGAGEVGKITFIDSRLDIVAAGN